MSNIINSFSTSLSIDLKESFEYNEEYIKSFIPKIPEYFQKDLGKEKLNDFHNLKTFLGKKRKDTDNIYEINEEDIKTNRKYFGQKKEIKKISVWENEGDFILKVKEKDKYEETIIYNKPIVITEIYDPYLLHINLINDDETLSKKMNNLDKYDFNIYSLEKGTRNLLNDGIILKENILETFDIENETIKPFLAIMRSRIPKLQNSDINLLNIYPKLQKNNNIIYGKDISKIFFYYFNINSDLQEKYIYVNSENRKELFSIMSSFLKTKIEKVLVITGPKGIGKTTSLIKFSYISEFRIFYFNIEVFEKNKNEENQILELRIQLAKILGDLMEYVNEESKKEIEEYITNERKKNWFGFIKDIIILFDKLLQKSNINKSNFCFIIDQLSIINNEKDESNINQIITLIRKTEKIKLIICPTINNIFSKTEIELIFNECLRDNYKIYTRIYYFQELISEEQMKSQILNNETNEYLLFIREIGYLPKLFYDSKLSDMHTYKNYLKLNLQENLNEYLKEEFDNTKRNIEILNLLDLIIGGKLICSTELRNNITKYPLNHLKIIKYKIDKNIINEFSDQNKNKEEFLLNYLSFLLTMDKNEKFDTKIKCHFNLEEGDIRIYLKNYFEKDKNSINIYGNYYKSFLEKNDKNKLFPSNKKLNSIYVYQFKLSILLFQDIIFGYIYQTIKKEYNFFRNILDNGANGGFFEILVDYYIKSSRAFLVKDINQIIYIPSLVPQNYSITNYSSKRKNNKKFKEFKLKKNQEKKLEILFDNTYIHQTIFNSKYYDMGILIKSKNNNKSFNLAVIQASIKKEIQKRMTKDEHELILGAVKENIENEFDIIIDEAYFVYVLSQKDNKIIDEDTVKDCELNGIKYIGFDLGIINNEQNEEHNRYIIDLNQALITKAFPKHNSASLLNYPITEKEKQEYLILNNFINNNIKNSKDINEDEFHIIEKIISNKFGPKDITANQFKFFSCIIDDKIGKFIFDFLTEFCFIIIKLKGGRGKNQIIYSYLCGFGIYYNLENFTFIDKLKLNKTMEARFFYSSIPLELKKD